MAPSWPHRLCKSFISYFRSAHIFHLPENVTLILSCSEHSPLSSHHDILILPLMTSQKSPPPGNLSSPPKLSLALCSQFPEPCFLTSCPSDLKFLEDYHCGSIYGAEWLCSSEYSDRGGWDNILPAIISSCVNLREITEALCSSVALSVK